MPNINNFRPLKFSTKRAFSLIELSIVLIIIGLLIAGITGGASLIKSASLRAAMGEARGYNVAVNSFYVQFDALPGDYATVIAAPGGIGTASVAGDANGRIEYANAATTGIIESTNAWTSLKNTGVIDTVLTYAPNNFQVANGAPVPSQTVGTHLPASKIKSAGWIFDYVTTGTPVLNQNVVILSASLLASANHVATTAQMATPVKIIPPTDALSIDTKMDDGVANAGRVRAHPSMTATCFATTTYATTNATNECALTFQVDIT